MAEKNLTNLAVLMDLLNVSTVELARIIAIERSSISKWRHGAQKILPDMPYFEKMVDYFIQKNELMGNSLLENLIESVYPIKKRIHKDYLKKCVRAFILDIPDVRLANTDIVSFKKRIGAEGRLDLFIALMEAAEKSEKPTVIKIFEASQFDWIGCNMQYSIAFYKKLKIVLGLGHKVEIIFQVNDYNVKNSELHQIFLELAFHENLHLYIYSSKANKAHVCSMYLMPQQIVIVGFQFDGNTDDMLSSLFRDTQYAEAHEKIINQYKAVSEKAIITSKQIDLEKIITHIRASIPRTGAFFYSGKMLSLITMSEELFEEILCANKLTYDQKRICYEVYHAFRTNVESSTLDEMRGFYYVLDEVTSPLSYPIITNYVLSAVAGKPVQMTREQYMQHFRDTAKLLLRDSRYQVHLHYSPIPMPMSISVTYPGGIWYKSENWVIVGSVDEYSEKYKFMFGHNPKMINIFQIGFMEIFSKIPQYKHDNTYVAEIFMRIANGEKI